MSREELLRLGWRRNAVTALFFGVQNLLDPSDLWRALQGRLLVAPVVGTLLYENVPDAVRAWADRVGGWDFRRVIPCHFDGPINAGPREWNAAFSFLRPRPAFRAPWDPPAPAEYWPAGDVALLRGLEDVLTNAGIIFTDANRPARRGSKGDGAGVQ